MYAKADEKPIGIFDSGVGGVSVLGVMTTLLPEERFIYFADSQNAPYGTKDPATVLRLSREAARFLCGKGIKALVVACNTATAVAINELRAELDIPVIGMEPAVKPATELSKDGKILVMATPVTLSQEKFNNLLHRFDEQSRVIPLPCPGLVELIEQGKTRGEEVDDYLQQLFSGVPMNQIEVVVLGCTHYVFLKDSIKDFFSPGIPIIDGNCGTAKQLRNILAGSDDGNLPEAQTSGKHANNRAHVDFYTSGDTAKIIPLCKKLLKRIS